MRLDNMAFAEMTEALNRGWENRGSRSPALLQLERCGLKVEVDPERIQEVFDRDPPHDTKHFGRRLTCSHSDVVLDYSCRFQRVRATLTNVSTETNAIPPPARRISVSSLT